MSKIPVFMFVLGITKVRNPVQIYYCSGNKIRLTFKPSFKKMANVNVNYGPV